MNSKLRSRHSESSVKIVSNIYRAECCTVGAISSNDRRGKLYSSEIVPFRIDNTNFVLRTIFSEFYQLYLLSLMSGYMQFYSIDLTQKLFFLNAILP